MKKIKTLGGHGPSLHQQSPPCTNSAPPLVTTIKNLSCETWSPYFLTHNSKIIKKKHNEIL